MAMAFSDVGLLAGLVAQYWILIGLRFSDKAFPSSRVLERFHAQREKPSACPIFAGCVETRVSLSVGSAGILWRQRSMSPASLLLRVSLVRLRSAISSVSRGAAMCIASFRDVHS